MKKFLHRLQHMDIELGTGIGEPLAILFNGPKSSRIWSGMAKLHLKNPGQDSHDLHRGIRPFILNLDDGAPTLAKIAKSWDPLAASSLLSIKVNSANLREQEAHTLFQAIVTDSFGRGQEFELTQVSKNIGNTFAFLTTTFPSKQTS